MVPAWTESYVGIPHVKRGRDRDGADCLGLFIMLSRERLNITIPDPYCTLPSAVRSGEDARNRWLYDEVTNPVEGDAILIRARGHPVHVGYCIDARLMLHSEDGAGSVVERWDGTKWKNRVMGLFRYAGPRGQPGDV